MTFIHWPKKDKVEWKTAICWGQDKIVSQGHNEQSSQSCCSDIIGQQHGTLMSYLLCAIIFLYPVSSCMRYCITDFFSEIWVTFFFAVVTLQDMLSMFCCIIETCPVNTNLSESETLELVCEESVLFLPVRPPGLWLC